MKSERQIKILEIVSNLSIETQEELSEHLKREGFFATQTTISRDIKDLRLVKVMTESGSYKYATSVSESEGDHIGRLKTIFRECVTGFDMAKNIVVLKTIPGLASAACSALDNLNVSKVVGTIAGDDTCLIVMRDDVSAGAFIEEIRNMLL